MSEAKNEQGSMAQRTAQGIRLLVMMPALNESATIENVINSIPREIDGVDSVEVLVVDDGSTDDTAELARGAGASVLSHRKNMGVGVALHSGFDESIRRGVDITVNIDSDGQFNAADIPKLIAPILREKADFVTASRFKDPALVPVMPKMKRFGNWGMAHIVSQIIGQRMYDVSCGFRAYSRESLLQMVLTGKFTYTQETLLVLANKGLGIAEVPMVVRGEREFGTSRVASSLWRYGTKTLGIILSVIRDYRPGLLFNTVGAFLMTIATALAAFFLWHRFTSGQFQPHIWSGFVAAYLGGLGVITFGMGQVALMVGRLRAVQDKQLYLLRRHLATSKDVAAELPPKGDR